MCQFWGRHSWAKTLKSEQKTGYRSRANMAHIKQSKPDSELALQVKILKTFQGVPSSLGSEPAPMRSASCFSDTPKTMSMRGNNQKYRKLAIAVQHVTVSRVPRFRAAQLYAKQSGPAPKRELSCFLVTPTNSVFFGWRNVKKFCVSICWISSCPSGATSESI